jgi:glycosyltransferase involved in cell wall biosynthesis
MPAKHSESARKPMRGHIRVVRIIARVSVAGPAWHVLELTRGLDQTYPTLLVTGEVDADEVEVPDLLPGAAHSVYRIPELGRRLRFGRDVVAFIKVLRLLLKVRPDIVDTHTAKAGTIGRLAALIARVPIRVHTFHGHVFHSYFGSSATKLFIWLERILARFTTRIIAISPSQADELVEVYQICPRHKIEVMPIGLDLTPYTSSNAADLRAGFRAELGVAEIPLLTAVGRLVPVKNHMLMLDAVAQLIASGRSCLLAIVGDGPERERLRNRAEFLGIAKHVRFLGWRHDLTRIYAGSDIVVLSSLNEGTPVCLLEALAAGVPVIATNVGGVKDVLDGGALGMLVAANDVRAMSSAMIELLDNQALRQQLSLNGRRVVMDRYSTKRLVDDTNKLYGRLLANSRSGHASAILPIPQMGSDT